MRPRRSEILLLLSILTGMACGAPSEGPPAKEEERISFNPVGHPTFMSPHARPIGFLANASYVYAVNTPADTVDVIDAGLGEVVARIHVGIDPVGIGVRPDGREIWVSNHISDSVSVIDSDPASPTHHQVIATIQEFDPLTKSTLFDEPVGIAFANDSKAYVALSSENLIAIIDVASRSVTGHLEITAQDPRAIEVRGNRLYVVPFESGNQTELSGCIPGFNGVIDGNQCTFSLVDHVINNNNVLSLFYDADIVRDPRVPDRDLFVYDTSNDTLVDVVSSVGSLLYGVTADSTGKVFVAMTEARNDANGRAGTLKHELIDLDNRAFLNQIGVIDCGVTCGPPSQIELEPLPPENPDPGMGLATPFAIEISEDDTTLIVTAAGSDQLFTLDAASGNILGRVGVGGAPRGVALESGPTGAPERAWVLNAVENTVTSVDLSVPSSPTVEKTILLEDPTHPDVKSGRLAFNDANASSTGTFSCESCHPDGHTDQLLWVLGGPECQLAGCRQIPPRSTMPIRGLRDTAPYHWDGVPGDPFGGRNGANPFANFDPNCTTPESCTRHLLDGALASTMCDLTNCPRNDEDKAGLLDRETRDAMAIFLLSVPYPPARQRPHDDQISDLARQGFFEFFDNGGRPSCGRVGCHELPLWTGTNIGGFNGMDAPTFRGLPDRWLILPQGRINMFELVSVVGPDNSEFPFSAARGFEELGMWALAGFGTEENPGNNRVTSGFGPLGPWQMFLEGSMGHSGAFSRQITLNQDTAAVEHRAATEIILASLEGAAVDGFIELQGEGMERGAAWSTIGLAFEDGVYRPNRATSSPLTRQQVLDLASDGRLIVTLTGRLGPNVDVDHPQPTLFSRVEPGFVRHRFPRLSAANEAMTILGRHIAAGASIVVDGDRVSGEIGCTLSEELPDCSANAITIQLENLPTENGMHLLQVQNPAGLLSNEFLFFTLN